MSLFSNPLSKIIVLSVVLAVGFLATILAGALYKNWLPLISAAFFAVAQLPLSVFHAKSKDDFMSESSAYVADLGRFLSAFLTISGFGINLVLYHSRQINATAMILSIVGGVLINGTIFAFSSFFETAEEAELTGFEI